jgi:hypothetical protein
MKPIFSLNLHGFLLCLDAQWRCHVSDCNTPEQVMNKRADTCCFVISPLLQAIDRSVALQNGPWEQRQ